MNAKRPPSRLVLLGHPVAHSLSPQMHNAALHSAGLPQRYQSVDVDDFDLATAIRNLWGENGAGNVTVPHKGAVFALCDVTTPVASRAGAVNTFWFDDDALVGHNTDVAAAKLTIEALVPEGLEGMKCAVIGAGGAAAAVLLALENLQVAEVRIHSRTAGRARRLANRVSVNATECDTLEDAMSGAALVVNSTPVGLTGQEVPFDVGLLDPGAALFDLTYRARNRASYPDSSETGAIADDLLADTPLVLAAVARGIRAVSGLDMLVEQGALAFECWFGTEAPREVMRAAVGMDRNSR